MKGRVCVGKYMRKEDRNDNRRIVDRYENDAIEVLKVAMGDVMRSVIYKGGEEDDNVYRNLKMDE